MFETIIREAASKFGLGDKAGPLVQMLLAYITNKDTGGIGGFISKLTGAGLGNVAQSWMGGGAAPQAINPSQIESLLGGQGGLISNITSKLGIGGSAATSALGFLLPAIIGKLTPGGKVPTSLPSELMGFMNSGKDLLAGGAGAVGSAVSGAMSGAAGGVASAGAAAGKMAGAAAGMAGSAAGMAGAAAGKVAGNVTNMGTAVGDAAGGGFMKWLPWIGAGLVALLALGYCSKSGDDATKTATKAAGAVTSTASNAAGAAAGAATGAAGAATAAAGNVTDAAAKAAAGAAGAATAAAGNVADAAGKAAAGAAGAAAATVGNVADAAGKAAVGAATATAGNVADAAGKAAAGAAGAASAALGGAADAASKAAGAAASTVAGAAAKAADAAKDAAKTAAGSVAASGAGAAAASAGAGAAMKAGATGGASVLASMINGVPALKVYFATSKTDVAPEFADKAAALVAYLKSNASAKAVVSGFNDPRGNPEANAELAKNRGKMVAAALKALGVADDRIVAEKPADPTAGSAQSNAEARRVEVTIRK